MTPTNRTPATAADFVEYVAELRADGMSDADVLVRYFKTARPGLTLRIHADAVAIYCDQCEIEWGELHGDEAGAYHVTITSGYKLLTTETFDSLEDALAWLANQLRERCPVAAIRDSRDERAADGAPFRRDAPVIVRELWFHLSGEHFGDAEHAASAARIRRMFAIAEPGEVVNG